MECWAFILTVAFGKTEGQICQLYAPDAFYPQGNSFLLEAEWASGLLNTDIRNASLENFQGFDTASNTEPPVCGTVPQPTAAPLAPVIPKATLNLHVKLILFAY
jgi:hypothetical protein